MKKVIALLMMAAMALCLYGCGCKHVWTEATCTDPKICSECGETEGEALGHTMVLKTMSDTSREEICTACGRKEYLKINDITTECLELLEGEWCAGEVYNGLEVKPADAPFSFTFSSDGTVESELEENPGTGTVTYRRYDSWMEMFYFDVEVNGVEYDLLYEAANDELSWWHKDRYLVYLCTRE